MEALAQGWPGARQKYGLPPDDDQPIVIWGQLWQALVAIPRAIERNRPFWHLDNGWVKPGRGNHGPDSYYRMTYRGMIPAFLTDAPPSRIKAAMMPWRADGRHVLIAMPGREFGQAIGLDMVPWIESIVAHVRQHTDRPIVVRDRLSKTPLDADMRNCWALVTHSSNVAVDAVLMGVPVFVAPTNPAAPVGNLDLAQMETPQMPDRTRWFDSLMAQQFTVDEMRSGLAREYLQMVIDRKIAA